MKRWFIAAVVLALACSIIVPILKVRFYDKEFATISDGSSQDAVLARMGRPWKREPCGEYIGGVAPGCTQEFIYAHPYAPYMPQYWVIQFDKDKRVVSHVNQISP